MSVGAPVAVAGLSVGALIVATFAVVVVAHVRRGVHGRRIGPVREALADLAVRVALDDDPVPPPAGALGRRVARDLVAETLRDLSGAPASRATRWLDEHGFVDEARAALGSASTWRRAEAAHVLGRLGGARAEPWLIDGLDDPRYSVRDACAAALGRIGGAASVRPLIAALERRRVPQGRVCGALIGLHREANTPLAAAIEHDDAAVRALIARVLGLRGACAAAGALLAGLHDPAPNVRRHCALALAGLGVHMTPAGVRRRLAALADDEVPFVRAAAATALGSLYGERVLPALIRLAGDEDFWVGYRATEAIAALPGGDGIGWRLLEGDEPFRARRRVLERLERTGGVERRLRSLAEAGGEGLLEAVAALRRSGARSWDPPPAADAA